MSDSSTNSELRFDGRVALVTGAGGGLGREYSLLLAERGARVIVNDIGGVEATAQKGASAQRTVDEILALGGEAVADTHSVATSEGGAAMVAGALERFGRLDIVVHNAGVGRMAPSFEEITDEQLEIVFKTHVFGAFHVLRPAWRQMKQQKYGRIVNTCSATALGVDDSWDYPAAKGALWSLTRSLALTGARLGIKVNAIMPMAFTPMSKGIPSAELRDWMAKTFPAALVAPTVALLAHEQAPCSGECLSVGAGRTGRVGVVVSPGYTTSAPTPEALLEHFAEVVDEQQQVRANSGAEDTALFPGGWEDLSSHRMAAEPED